MYLVLVLSSVRRVVTTDTLEYVSFSGVLRFDNLQSHCLLHLTALNVLLGQAIVK
jgi:hypothetical protein